MPGKHYPKKMRAGETTTEYRNRLSGAPTAFSERLIREHKENKIKQKEKQMKAEKDHVASIKAKISAKKYGSYKMYPGKHSEVNPGNFKGSEVAKYGAMKMHPMKFPDLSGDGKITQADILMGKGVIDKPKDMHPKMYGKPQAHHPMKYDEKKTLKYKK